MSTFFSNVYTDKFSTKLSTCLFYRKCLSISRESSDKCRVKYFRLNKKRKVVNWKLKLKDKVFGKKSRYSRAKRDLKNLAVFDNNINYVISNWISDIDTHPDFPHSIIVKLYPNLIFLWFVTSLFCFRLISNQTNIFLIHLPNVLLRINVNDINRKIINFIGSGYE